MRPAVVGRRDDLDGAQSVAVDGTGETTYTFGGTTDTWGRTWTLAELGPRTSGSGSSTPRPRTNKRFDLDYVAVSVTYHP